MRALLTAVLAGLRRDGRALVGALLSVAVGTAALTLVLGLGRGVERLVLTELLSLLPVNVVKVEPRLGVALGPLRLGGGGVLAPALDAAAVQALRDTPGVVDVCPVLPARFPMRAQGGASLLGRDVYSDMFAYGMDPRCVGGDADPAAFQAEGEPVPVVVSDRVIGIYNRTVAPAIGSPRLTEQAVRGLGFTLVLGESYAAGRRGQGTKVVARVVGTSPRAPLAGITVPLATVEAWNARYVKDGAPDYSAAYVVARSAREVDAVVERADALGLSVDHSARLVGAAIRGATAALATVAGLILLMAALFAARTFEARAAARRKEIALLRAFGASRGQVRGLIAGEAALVGLAAAVLGVALGSAAGAALSAAARQLLRGLIELPAGVIALDPLVVGLPLAAALLAALLGGLGPARRAARLDPVVVLSGRER